MKKTASNKPRKYIPMGMHQGTEGDQLYMCPTYMIYVSHIYDSHACIKLLVHLDSVQNLLNFTAWPRPELKHLVSHFYAGVKQVYYTKLCVYIYTLCIHGKLSGNDCLVI